jgi:thiamine kinase-like enzyme
MKSIPEHIRSNLRQLNLSSKELIFKNDRKGRYNIIAVNNSESYFVKINDPSVSEEHTQKFRRELEFYKTTQRSRLYPNYIDSNQNILALENLQAESLRHWIINYIENDSTNEDVVSDKFTQFTANLQKTIERLYFSSQVIPNSICEAKKPDIDEDELFISYISNNCSRLFTSGPMNTSRGWIEQKWGSILRTGYINLFRQELSKILSNTSYEPDLEPVHSDLHQDNVLVSDKNTVHIVDWENCRYGFWISDIAFLSATIFALLRNHPNHYEKVDEAISEIILQYEKEAFPIFDWVRSSMKNAISTNRRFHHNPSHYQLIYGFGKVNTQMMSVLPTFLYERINI